MVVVVPTRKGCSQRDEGWFTAEKKLRCMKGAGYMQLLAQCGDCLSETGDRRLKPGDWGSRDEASMWGFGLAWSVCQRASVLPRAKPDLRYLCIVQFSHD